MPYEPYATAGYYSSTYQGTTLEDVDDITRWLKQASRHIDSLTYNRIVGRGFSNLTPYQREIVQEVCCMQADFEYQNADEIESVLQSYSINGVTAQFGGGWNTHVENGVMMRADVYSMLAQTGLCCRLVG